MTELRDAGSPSRSTRIAQVVATILVLGVTFALTSTLESEFFSRSGRTTGLFNYIQGDYPFSFTAFVIPWAGLFITAGYTFCLFFLGFFLLSVARRERTGGYAEILAWSAAALAVQTCWGDPIFPADFAGRLSNFGTWGTLVAVTGLIAIPPFLVIALVHRWIGLARRHGLNGAEQILLFVALLLAQGTHGLSIGVAWVLVLRGEIALVAVNITRRRKADGRHLAALPFIEKLMPARRVREVIDAMRGDTRADDCVTVRLIFRRIFTLYAACGALVWIFLNVAFGWAENAITIGMPFFLIVGYGTALLVFDLGGRRFSAGGIEGRSEFGIPVSLYWSEIDSVTVGWVYVTIRSHDLRKKITFSRPWSLWDVPTLVAAVRRYAPEGNPFRTFVETRLRPGQ